MTLITGAGGFIGGALVSRQFDKDLQAQVRAVDKKALPDWYQRDPAAESLCLDLSDPTNCRRAVENCDTVINLAADMGGMGFIESNRVACLRNVLINTNLIEAAWRAGVKRYFFSSSACIYPTHLQREVDAAPLKETDAYPARAERGYGWEKLFSEMLCEEYFEERGMSTFIARFHNIYGPHGSWNDGREKAPAALCRKAANVMLGRADSIEIWGDGEQTRSFCYIDDCLEGIERIIDRWDLSGLPINLGSSELISINGLVDVLEEICGVQFKRTYRKGPLGVRGRSSDNTLIKSVLDWEPSTPLRVGLERTYDWIVKEMKR